MVYPFEEEELEEGMVQEPVAPAPAEMNPIVKDHLMKKFNLGEYNDEARKKLVEDNSSYDVRGSIGAALIAAGGGDGLSALKNRQAERNKSLEAFDKGRSNKIQEYNLDRQFGKDSREDASNVENDDVTSQMSLIKQNLAKKMSPGIDWTKMSGSQIEKLLPSVQKLYEIDQKGLERQESRDERRFLFNQTLQDRKEARADKQEELSVPKAKQRGLYESGLKAEQQYQDATADKKEYDPTGVGQFIDNSDWAPNLLKNNKAIEAQAAQSAWIEAFLRDASGAAIPPSERGAYAKDFFPQSGDPANVVANKKALREQKMANAALGSGIKNASVSSSKPSKKEVVKTQTNPKTGQKRVVYSDGSFEVIDPVAGR